MDTSQNNGWFSANEKLPEDKTYVFAIHNLGTWFDPDDPIKVSVVVAKFVRGLSLVDREKMPDCERKKLYSSCDEFGNNEKPYCWDTFGPGEFFGQDIIYWKPIDLPLTLIVANRMMK